MGFVIKMKRASASYSILYGCLQPLAPMKKHLAYSLYLWRPNEKEKRNKEHTE